MQSMGSKRVSHNLATEQHPSRKLQGSPVLMVRAGSLAVIRLSLMRRRRRGAAGEGCPPRRGERAARPPLPSPALQEAVKAG